MRRSTVTLVQVTTVTDPLGNEETTEVETEVRGCLLAPRSSTERTDPRSPAVISGAGLYMPASAPVPNADDHFLIAGELYEVEGEAGVWPGRGIEVAVKHIPA